MNWKGCRSGNDLIYLFILTKGQVSHHIKGTQCWTVIFQRNILPPEDGGSMSLLSAGIYLQVYTWCQNPEQHCHSRCHDSLKSQSLDSWYSTVKILNLLFFKLSIDALNILFIRPQFFEMLIYLYLSNTNIIVA